MYFLCLLVPHGFSLFETITKDSVHKRELEVNTSRGIQLSVGPICYKSNSLRSPAPQTTTVGDTNFIRRMLVFYEGQDKKKDNSSKFFSIAEMY